MDSQGRSGDGKCGEEKTPAHATNSTLSSKERATTERREEKDGGGGEDKGRKESRRRGEEEEEHGRQTFPARALEQREQRGWRRDGAAAAMIHTLVRFWHRSGQSAHGRFKLQCRGNRLHNVVLPTATDASSSFT